MSAGRVSTRPRHTLALLRTIGIDHAQGYAVHRPAPLEEILQARGIGPQGKPRLKVIAGTCPT